MEDKNRQPLYTTGDVVRQTHHHQTLKFPKDFLWGSATSAYQVEGGCTNNDWWEFEKISGLVANGDRTFRNSDHYHLFEEDFELAQSLNLNAHRLSIEWSRLEPREGEWNEKEIAHYKSVFQSLKKRGVKIMLTLHHFTNPTWFAARGGFAKRKNVKFFNRFVKKVVAEYGAMIDFWVTFNEPMIYITQGFLQGIWPPRKKSVWLSISVFFNLLRAHKRAYRDIHTAFPKAMVGIANNNISVVTYEKHSLGEMFYVRFIDFLWNHIFVDFTKKYHDFLGLNYYFHQRVEKKDKKRHSFDIFVDIRKEKREVSDMGWEVYPEGIFDALLDLKQYNLPIYVTENGIASLNDDRRARFLVAYLQAVYRAINAGVPVKGYFYWSLLDNFEWDKGYAPRFGLVAVDYRTLMRKLRYSGLLYGAMAKENGIPHKILSFVGHNIKAKDFIGENYKDEHQEISL